MVKSSLYAVDMATAARKAHGAFLELLLYHHILRKEFTTTEHKFSAEHDGRWNG